MDFNSYYREDPSDGMSDDNTDYTEQAEHTYPPERTTWSIKYCIGLPPGTEETKCSGKVLGSDIYVDSDDEECCNLETGWHYTPNRSARLKSLFDRASLSDEPRSPPRSVTSTSLFPKPTPRKRSPALCYNTTRFNNDQAQSPEGSSSFVVQKLDFSSWYET